MPQGISNTGVPTSLVEASSDPRRRGAESKIRRVKDRIILVEGSLDFHYFTETCKKEGLTFKIQGGKDNIVSRVKESSDYYGIVDMDHDFKSKTIANTERLTDTNGRCCLYSYVSLNKSESKEKADKEIVKDAKEIIARLSERDSEVMLRQQRIIGMLTSSKGEFVRHLRERTLARLWRGQEGDNQRTVMKGGVAGHTWEHIIEVRANREIVSDLVDEKKAIEFENWKNISLNRVHKEDVGIRDHDLHDGIMLLLRGAGIKIKGKYGYSRYSRKVNDEIKRLVGRKGDTMITNRILSRLGI